MASDLNIVITINARDAGRGGTPTRCSSNRRADPWPTRFIALANPSDAAQYHLAPVNKDEQLAAHAGLGDTATVVLAMRGQVTLEQLIGLLRDEFDILYLVAHGMLVEGEPWLFLERADGTADRVSGSELATCIQELDNRPRMAVLVSCQSAGTGESKPTTKDQGALAGAGPRLAEAGVPAATKSVTPMSRSGANAQRHSMLLLPFRCRRPCPERVIPPDAAVFVQDVHAPAPRQ